MFAVEIQKKKGSFSTFSPEALKGLGHANLGNFSTDRMVIELTKISK